jgi:SAM-dependent methyltransferase
VIGVDAFVPQPTCWICAAADFDRVHGLLFELSEYSKQDPDLAAYTGRGLALCRCRQCGFAQPEALPALPRYFDRLYDQRWSDAWIASEFEAAYKDYIFAGVLSELARRLDASRRRLLDVGAHAGRFVALAAKAGWAAEGLELNPKTAAYAAARTGAPIRQLNVHDAGIEPRAYDAVTVTDVLEHIPRPADVLARAFELLAPGGWIAVKVPCGPSQLFKETWRGRLQPGYRPTVADNLVHVSHFSAASLRLALERAGFSEITIAPGAPELPAGSPLSRAVRMATYYAARAVPGAVSTPLTLNLQAYARRG